MADLPTPVCLSLSSWCRPCDLVSSTRSNRPTDRGRPTRRNTETLSRGGSSPRRCWVQLSSLVVLNGFKGWHERPWDGKAFGHLSGIQPGPTPVAGCATWNRHALPLWPQEVRGGGYKISYPVQLYNYVIAINYNRQSGKRPPRNTNQPDRTTGSGYWIHQRGLGSTRMSPPSRSRHNLALDATDCAAPDHHGGARAVDQHLAVDGNFKAFD